MDSIEITSPSESVTRQLGQDLSLVLQTGDLLLLSGELGAGKSLLARSVIRSIARDDALDVASPTYTLCNLYPGELQVAHFDFYRIGDPEEVEELGLEDALEAGCALVEWPEQGLREQPEGSVVIQIDIVGESSRKIRISGAGDLYSRLSRSLEIREFLQRNGFSEATRERFSADASARRYETIRAQAGDQCFLMDAPAMPDGPSIKSGKPYSRIAHLAEDVSAFIGIAKLLRRMGYAAPDIPAFDEEKGIVLVEDLGRDLIINPSREPIPERYNIAMEFLASLHCQTIESVCPVSDTREHRIPCYDREALMIEVDLLAQWYVPRKQGGPIGKQQLKAFEDLWSELISGLDDQPTTLVLRDFHSPNIIWRGSERGTDRIGLIDFQDAVLGPTCYDVGSLAQDARVDISEGLEQALLDHYVRLASANDPGFCENSFRTGYAVMTAQRATKILGIFIRLDERDGKPEYLTHLPRIEGYLRRSLRHPVLSGYREWLHDVIEL